MKSLIEDLRKIFTEATEKEPYNGLLFSGGLDTSILAAINPRVRCVTVSLETGAKDIYYSKLLSESLNLEHFHREVSVDEAIECVPEVIRLLKTFDPAIPNDLVVYFGLREAKKLGITSIATGDGSDELFGGYSFMQDIKDLAVYIEKISRNMFFGSNVLAESLGLNLRQPYMDRDVVNFALRVPVDLKICENNEVIRGKWILRKAFEDTLPHEVAWQDKRPLEIGSGMAQLRGIITSRISDSEFEKKQKAYPVKFLNKEHLYYYEIYRREVGEIPTTKESEKSCPGCGVGMKIDAFHCKLCGNVLVLQTEKGR